MKAILASLAALLLLAGCRGQVSSKPPVHVFLDMDDQPKWQPQEASALFPDGRASRPPVEGTVARGRLFEDEVLYTGKVGGQFVPTVPGEVDERRLRHGMERYNIYCTPCHDRSGSGRGIAVQRGFPLPPDLSGDRQRSMPDGEMFEIITNGIRNMPAYGAQVPAEDRWDIVAWVRVLQRSQHAVLDDVPAEMRSRIEPEGGGQ